MRWSLEIGLNTGRSCRAAFYDKSGISNDAAAGQRVKYQFKVDLKPRKVGQPYDLVNQIARNVIRHSAPIPPDPSRSFAREASARCFRAETITTLEP